MHVTNVVNNIFLQVDTFVRTAGLPCGGHTKTTLLILIHAVFDADFLPQPLSRQHPAPPPPPPPPLPPLLPPPPPQPQQPQSHQLEAKNLGQLAVRFFLWLVMREQEATLLLYI